MNKINRRISEKRKLNKNASLEETLERLKNSNLVIAETGEELIFSPRISVRSVPKNNDELEAAMSRLKPHLKITKEED